MDCFELTLLSNNASKYNHKLCYGKISFIVLADLKIDPNDDPSMLL